jgi:VWFA-related protein
VINVKSNLVQVDAVVTDDEGRQVKDLRADDFEIVEDGQKRPPEFFSYVSLDAARAAPADNAQPSPRAPRRIFAFVVSNPLIDVGFSFAGPNGAPPSSGSFVTQARAQSAAEETHELLSWFVDHELNERDLAAIGDTDVDLGVLASFTSDRDVLHEAIRQVRADPTSGRSPVVHLMVVNGELTLQPLLSRNLRVLDMLASVIKQLEPLPGRKVVAFIARGLLYNPSLPYSEVVRARMQQLIEQCNRAHISIYTLRPVALNPEGGNQGSDALIRLADETGGRAIYNTNDLRVGFREVLEENRGYYLLAYNPGAETIARPHRIEVRVKRPDLHVHTRATAYSRAASGNSARGAATPQGVGAALDVPFAADEIAVALTPELVGADGPSPRVVTALHVALNACEPQTTPAGQQVVVLELVVRVTGPDGRTIKDEGRTLTLRLGADDLRAGFSANFEFTPARAGFYRIGVAARDTVSGRTGSATRFIAVARAKQTK